MSLSLTLNSAKLVSKGFLFFFFYFLRQGLICSLGCWCEFVAERHLELAAILLPPPPQC